MKSNVRSRGEDNCGRISSERLTSLPLSKDTNKGMQYCWMNCEGVLRSLLHTKYSNKSDKKRIKIHLICKPIRTYLVALKGVAFFQVKYLMSS